MKSVIFDLGAVMVDWNPQSIAQHYAANTDLQQTIVKGLFSHQNWLDFDNGLITEKTLVTRSADVIGLPEGSIRTLVENAKASLSAKVAMVELLQLAKDTGLNTYCLSNLSHEWFAYLQQRYDFFKLFDGKVISAQEGLGKPNLAIYQRLINRYQIEPLNALFIDDREENTQAARLLNISTVTFKHSEQNLADIRQFILN